MYVTKKFKKLGTSAALLSLVLASCQLIVGCGGDDDNPGPSAGTGNAGKAGSTGSAGKAGNTNKAGASSGGKAGSGAAGEGDAGEGEAGGQTGGTSGGGTSGGGTSGGGSGGAGTSGGGAAGSAGTAGKAGSGGNAGAAGGSAGAAGKAGSGGSGGNAGAAGGSAGASGGSGGSISVAGSGGMSGGGGNPGSSGSGGSAGGAVCGNNILETGEVCDPKYSVNNCGKDCKAITSAACLSCDNQTDCADFVNCSQLSTNAAAGSPAAGVPKANLCNEVLDCVRDSGCAASGNAIIKCYCGTASVSDCQNGLANGACKTEIERGLETTTFNLISQRLKSLSYGGGVALARIDCEQQVCITECGLN